MGFENEVKLFQKSKEILSKYEVSLKQKGGTFNIFSITNVERKEVDTHSRMLFELLNPKGSHFQGDVFLKLFLTEVLKINDFDTRSVHLFREKTIDEGRIDIQIENGDYIIIIEVKIDAHDGIKQIVRYENYVLRRNTKYLKKKKTLIVYLTEEGTPSRKKSSDGIQHPELVLNISFYRNILHWLFNCIEAVKKSNILDCEGQNKLEQALKQYHDLLQKMAGNIDKGAEDKLIDLLLMKKENFETALNLVKILPRAKEELMKSLLEPVFKIEGYEQLRRNEEYASYVKTPKSGKVFATYKISVDEKFIVLTFEIDWRHYFFIEKDGNETFHVDFKNKFLEEYKYLLEDESEFWGYIKAETNPNKNYMFNYDGKDGKSVDDYYAYELLEGNLIEFEKNNISQKVNELMRISKEIIRDLIDEENKHIISTD